MDQTKQPGELHANPADGELTEERVRKPYQKPAFQFERVFETMALACGKVGTLQKHCKFGHRKNS